MVSLVTLAWLLQSQSGDTGAGIYELNQSSKQAFEFYLKTTKSRQIFEF